MLEISMAFPVMPHNFSLTFDTFCENFIVSLLDKFCCIGLQKYISRKD